jgi:hypothetical protein
MFKVLLSGTLFGYGSDSEGPLGHVQHTPKVSEAFVQWFDTLKTGSRTCVEYLDNLKNIGQNGHYEKYICTVGGCANEVQSKGVSCGCNQVQYVPIDFDFDNLFGPEPVPEPEPSPEEEAWGDHYTGNNVTTGLALIETYGAREAKRIINKVVPKSKGHRSAADTVKATHGQRTTTKSSSKNN